MALDLDVLKEEPKRNKNQVTNPDHDTRSNFEFKNVSSWTQKV